MRPDPERRAQIDASSRPPSKLSKRTEGPSGGAFEMRRVRTKEKSEPKMTAGIAPESEPEEPHKHMEYKLPPLRPESRLAIRTSGHCRRRFGVPDHAKYPVFPLLTSTTMDFAFSPVSGTLISLAEEDDALRNWSAISLFRQLLIFSSDVAVEMNMYHQTPGKQSAPARLAAGRHLKNAFRIRNEHLDDERRRGSK